MASDKAALTRFLRRRRRLRIPWSRRHCSTTSPFHQLTLEYTSEYIQGKLHDEAGAQVLASISSLCRRCVRLDVAAKRYLCATDSSYTPSFPPFQAQSGLCQVSEGPTHVGSPETSGI